MCNVHKHLHTGVQTGACMHTYTRIQICTHACMCMHTNMHLQLPSSQDTDDKNSPNLPRKLLLIKIQRQGLPWWRSGWESACWCRGHGFEPWAGKVPRAAERLGPWATTAETARLEPVFRNRRGRDEEWPPLATTRESPRTEMKTQHSQK